MGVRMENTATTKSVERIILLNIIELALTPLFYTRS